MRNTGGISCWRRCGSMRRQRLAVEGETSQAQHRHAAYYLALAERAEPELNGAGQLRWLDRLEREHDNLRAALAWCLDTSTQAQENEDAQAGETGLRVAGALHWFWLFREHYAEGLAWLERALAAWRCRAGDRAGQGHVQRRHPRRSGERPDSLAHLVHPERRAESRGR